MNDARLPAREPEHALRFDPRQSQPLIERGLRILDEMKNAWADWPMDRGNLARTGTQNKFKDTSRGMTIFDGIHQHPIPERKPKTWIFEAYKLISTTPAVLKDLILFGCDWGRFFAVEAATGEQRWSRNPDQITSGSPAIASGIVYVGSGWHSDARVGHLYAIDADTGRQLWKFAVGELFKCSSPVIADGVVYFGTDSSLEYYEYCDGDACPPHHLYAVDASSGEQIWSFPTLGGTSTSPTVAAGVVYFSTDEGQHFAIDNVTGRERWTLTGVSSESSPTIVDGVLYVGSDDRHLYAIDINTGDRLWSLETPGWIRSSPAVVDGVIYVGISREADGELYAVEASTGSLRWSFHTVGKIASAPAVSEGIVYIGSLSNRPYDIMVAGCASYNFDVVPNDADNGHLYAIDVATGIQQWVYDTDARVYCSIAVTKDTVYLVCDSHLHAVDVATGICSRRKTFATRARVPVEVEVEDSGYIPF